MYPQHELIRLGSYKAALRRRIGTRRVQLADELSRVAAPFAVVDRMLGLWHRISPLVRVAVVPLFCFFARLLTGRLKRMNPLMRWGPMVLGVLRRIWASEGFRRGRKGARR